MWKSIHHERHLTENLSFTEHDIQATNLLASKEQPNAFWNCSLKGHLNNKCFQDMAVCYNYKSGRLGTFSSSRASKNKSTDLET